MQKGKIACFILCINPSKSMHPYKVDKQKKKLILSREEKLIALKQKKKCKSWESSSGSKSGYGKKKVL